MKKYTNSRLNILLATGLLLVILGLLIFAVALPVNTFVKSYWPVLILVAGAILLYLALTIIHNSFLLFIGLNLCFSGVVMLFTTTHFFPVTIEELWPVIAISSGIALVLCSLYNTGHIRAVYQIPAILLIALGVFFLLFSFDIIKMSFSRFINLFWPFLLIMLGGTLIGIFFYQRKFPENFPYADDDTELDEIDDCNGADK
ncbi:MAG: DUF5668 domain-containing protein [Treponema sp.]|nr:DUF5668 domain-containing protein [Treponema sp.]